MLSIQFIHILINITQENPLDAEKVKAPEPTVYRFPEIQLTQNDQQALEGGHWLTSTHISAVTTLLTQQYPGQNGL